MRKLALNLLAIIMVMFSVTAFACGDKKAGKVTTTDGEVIKGMVMATDVVTASNKVVIVTEDGQERSFKPSEVESFISGNDHFKSIELPGLISKKVFAKQVTQGDQSLFVYYFYTTPAKSQRGRQPAIYTEQADKLGNLGHKVVDYRFVTINDSKVTKLDKYNFRKQLKNMVDNNQEALVMLQKSQTQYINIPQVLKAAGHKSYDAVKASDSVAKL